MRAGRLRHRVTIQHRTLGQDDAGALVETWATTAVVWADVRTVGGGERLQPGIEQTVATMQHQVTIRRHPTTILPSQRVIWQGRTLEITSVQEPDNRQRLVLLMCQEIVEP